MTLTTDDFRLSNERINQLLSSLLHGSNIWFEFCAQQSLSIRHSTSNVDVWNSEAGRSRNHKQLDSSGGDVGVFYTDDPLRKTRFKMYVPKKKDGNTHDAPNYNYPHDVYSKKQMWKYLEKLNIYFCVFRIKHDSTLFWIDKYSNIPLKHWKSKPRFKGGRKDRIYLPEKTLRSLGKWNTLGINNENFIKKLKSILDENKD